MNRLTQQIILVLFPFFPFIAWVLYLITKGKYSIEFLGNLLLIPLALAIMSNKKIRLPAYLVCMVLFTLYHVFSAITNDAMPEGESTASFLLADVNIFACVSFFIVENTFFDDNFIRKLTKYLFLIVVLSLAGTLIQLKYPEFMAPPYLDLLATFGSEDQERLNSIYSFPSMNSLATTFPLLVGITINFTPIGKRNFYIILLSAIIVSFLSKGRSVMIAGLIVISQIFFVKVKTFSKRITVFAAFCAGILVMIFAVKMAGYDFDKVVSERILEKKTEMGSAKARITSYEVFLKVFPDNPIFGVGPKTRDNVLDLLGGEAPIIHVGYLCYLYYYGLAGSLLLFSVLFLLLRDFWNLGKQHNFWGAFFGFFAFVFTNTTMVYFNLGEMGIVMAVLYKRYYSLCSLTERRFPQMTVVKF